MKISLIISVYKKIRELELLLTALKAQSEKNFDVIIADDGSGAEMESFVKGFSDNCGYGISFVTQEDWGFRKNRILNEAVTLSKNNYLIFLDGDCIPHKNFIRAHFNNAAENTVLTGRRVHLSRKISDNLNPEYISSKEFSKLSRKAFLNSFKKEDPSTTAEEGFIIKSGFIRKLISGRNSHIVGCNFSLWKKMLLKINGFDENYVGAGIGEDTDIEYRLGLTGAKFKSVRNLAVVYHIYHSRTKESDTNYNYFHNNVKLGNQYFCVNGIVKKEKVK
ncbi:MAG: glycosyltransferase [Bacteroidetes bacterium]|nr:glycosyltransferase [Bacteroidota bacterium]